MKTIAFQSLIFDFHPPTFAFYPEDPKKAYSFSMINLNKDFTGGTEIERSDNRITSMCSSGNRMISNLACLLVKRWKKLCSTKKRQYKD
ncbi:hypothetical protein [Effusibacillus consociatus]|uniref:Uncharacterized protein n=1 Tax=Effusibacillus consociatus TaxID=1117041 RepID=A0ABV9Q3V8_9BACL